MKNTYINNTGDGASVIRILLAILVAVLTSNLAFVLGGICGQNSVQHLYEAIQSSSFFGAIWQYLVHVWWQILLVGVALGYIMSAFAISGSESVMVIIAWVAGVAMFGIMMYHEYQILSYMLSQGGTGFRFIIGVIIVVLELLASIKGLIKAVFGGKEKKK